MFKGIEEISGAAGYAEKCEQLVQLTGSTCAVEFLARAIRGFGLAEARYLSDLWDVLLSIFIYMKCRRMAGRPVSEEWLKKVLMTVDGVEVLYEGFGEFSYCARGLRHFSNRLRVRGMLSDIVSSDFFMWMIQLVAIEGCAEAEMVRVGDMELVRPLSGSVFGEDVALDRAEIGEYAISGRMDLGAFGDE
jgi:hypothetical protein